MKRSFIPFMILLIAVFFTACDRNRNHPGWDYFPDMFYSTAYESYTPNKNFADGKTMRSPVPGTVSREITPFQYGPGEEERTRAGQELVNPFKPNEEILSRGKEEYRIYCAHCHGDKGDGNGYLYTSGLYALKPRSLVGDVVRNHKDGEIYHTITLGFGSMGPHGMLVRPDDRWRIIWYIREDLQKNYKTGSDSIQQKK